MLLNGLCGMISEAEDVADDEMCLKMEVTGKTSAKSQHLHISPWRNNDEELTCNWPVSYCPK